MNETKKSPSQDSIYVEMLKEFAYAEIESKKAKEKEDKIWRAILQYEKENFNSQFAQKEVDESGGNSTSFLANVKHMHPHPKNSMKTNENLPPEPEVEAQEPASAGCHGAACCASDFGRADDTGEAWI